MRDSKSTTRISRPIKISLTSSMNSGIKKKWNNSYISGKKNKKMKMSFKTENKDLKAKHKFFQILETCDEK